MKKSTIVCGIILCLVFLQINRDDVETGVSSDRDKQLSEIFEAARGEFFTTLDKVIKINPRRIGHELSAALI